MQRKTLTLLAASMLAVCIGAFAADVPPAGDPPPAMQAGSPGAGPNWMMHRRDGAFRGHGMRARVSPAVRASIHDINAITRLYRLSGKTDQLSGFYRDVLNKTHNPVLRNFVYARLARLQSAPTDTRAAIATLRQSLDENLARIESHKQRHDK